jgi:surface antigen
MKKAVLVAIVLLCAACTPGGKRLSTGETLGLAGGTIVGSLIGAQFGAGWGQALSTVGAASLGGVVGYSVGHRYDPSDVRAFHASIFWALDRSRDGELSAWSNPATGVAGTITPTKTFQAEDGRTCRTYYATVDTGDASDARTATACRDVAGVWDLAAKV